MVVTQSVVAGALSFEQPLRLGVAEVLRGAAVRGIRSAHHNA